MLKSKTTQRLLVMAAFIAVLVIHFIWINLFPDIDPEQSAWASVSDPESVSWWARYLATQSYWLGYSYAISIAFAVFALLNHLSNRGCGGGAFAIGGVGLSGFLAAFGCFLIGCCGSPMLAVYMSLFGASVLPFAGPFVALFITIMIGLSWWWLKKKTAKCCETNIIELKSADPE